MLFFHYFFLICFSLKKLVNYNKNVSASFTTFHTCYDKIAVAFWINRQFFQDLS